MIERLRTHISGTLNRHNMLYGLAGAIKSINKMTDKINELIDVVNELKKEKERDNALEQEMRETMISFIGKKAVEDQEAEDIINRFKKGRL